MRKIADTFNGFFEVLEANTAELKNIAFSIRHSVYCEELTWEKKNQQKLEIDLHDEFAHHFLMKHKATGEFVGCIRYVINQDDGISLPLRKFFPDAPLSISLTSAGEVSRAAVLSTFRRRKSEKGIPVSLSPSEGKDEITAQLGSFPYIALGLYMCAAACAKKLSKDGLYMVVEPKLRKQLGIFGINLTQVGAEVDFKGKRALYFLSVDDLGKSALPSKVYDLFSNICNKLYGGELEVDKKEQIEFLLCGDDFIETKVNE